MFKFYRIRFFPLKKRSSRPYKYEALVGIGGNEGNVKKTFVRLLRLWQNDRRLHVEKTSFVLENPPFGYLEQANFFNALIRVKTSLSAKSFLKLLLHTEKIFGRKRSFKNAPRTLDLDIIFFNFKEQRDERLVLPHPFWHERASILAPLAFSRMQKINLYG
ncbi:MAG: 2-amino-4-hydroxy-6-hydroxymethyldihydropteridine diphosphokinase [Proteobacteria bacterium]|nr:MAG: 2-amino-4-hydroxy-6-hydroxymethyldihydropteridine diphosphokinase [Pseudomonadota bacterium]